MAAGQEHYAQANEVVHLGGTATEQAELIRRDQGAVFASPSTSASENPAGSFTTVRVRQSRSKFGLSRPTYS